MSGAVRSQCSACGAIFVSIAGFDVHRVGPYLPGRRRCLTIPEMLAEGMVQDDRGWWMRSSTPTETTVKREESA